MSRGWSCRASSRSSIANTPMATRSSKAADPPRRRVTFRKPAMSDPSQVLFVTRYYWPELIGSAPFSTDIAEWLAAHGRRTTVVSGLPHYPGTTVFPAYRDGGGRERVAGVDVERLECGPPRTPSAPSRILNEAEFLMRGLVGLATGRMRRHEVVLALCPSILCVALAIAARRRNGACIAIV